MTTITPTTETAERGGFTALTDELAPKWHLATTGATSTTCGKALSPTDPEYDPNLLRVDCGSCRRTAVWKGLSLTAQVAAAAPAPTTRRRGSRNIEAALNALSNEPGIDRHVGDGMPSHDTEGRPRDGGLTDAIRPELDAANAEVAALAPKPKRTRKPRKSTADKVAEAAAAEAARRAEVDAEGAAVLQAIAEVLDAPAPPKARRSRRTSAPAEGA